MTTQDDLVKGTCLEGVDIWICSDGKGHFFREGSERPVCRSLVRITGEEHPEGSAPYLCKVCVALLSPS